MSKFFKYTLYFLGAIFVLLLFSSFLPSPDLNVSTVQQSQQNKSVADNTGTIPNIDTDLTNQTTNSEPQQQTSNPALQSSSVSVPAINTSQPTPTPVITIQTSSSVCKIINYLPDSSCTPGAIDQNVTQNNINSTICVSGYTTTVRPSTSITSKIKTERMQAYGFTDSVSNYELDHLIPLELGGSPASVLNLFPEPYAEPYGARDKDKVENYLHQQVCNGSITLKTAQDEIKTDWVSVYNSCCSSPVPVTSVTTQQTAPPSTGHIYYTSSYGSSKYYYCDTDSQWKTLSAKYLRLFPSVSDLLATFPNRILHEPCN